MIPGSDWTNPDAANVPKWHTVRHLPDNKGIIAADPNWNVPFMPVAITGDCLLTEMRLPQMGSFNAVDSPGNSPELATIKKKGRVT
jgi:hypothetical protein